jgi:methylmalonyl-CoA/ethylmalonyl-CoA epimerase
MRVLGIDRVVIATPDVEGLAERYHDLLGIEWGDVLEPATETEVGEHPLVTTISAELDLTSPRDLDDDDNAVARFLKKRGPGLYGLALQVADLDEAREHLAERGVDPVGEMHWAEFDQLFYHPKDFEGVFVLLAEFPHSVETNYRIEFDVDRE